MDTLKKFSHCRNVKLWNGLWFVDLTESDAEEYKCGICNDIFRNPGVTNFFYKHFVNNVLMTGWKLIINVLLIGKNLLPPERSVKF